MMSRWVIPALLLTAIAVGVIAMVAVPYRYLQIFAYPIGGGRFTDSPDGRFTAHASNMYDEGFWGNSRRYYEFEVCDRKGTVLRSVQLPEPPNRIDFRLGAGRIVWAPYSKSVDFGTPQTTIWSTTLP